MSKLNINGVVGGNFSTFTVDGVNGYFRSVSRGGFCKIKHRFDGAPGGYVLVANVPNGNFGELGNMVNKQKQAQIMSKLEKYCENFNA